MISVIDMPPPEESIWWRGKRGFHVGFFPRECVQVADLNFCCYQARCFFVKIEFIER